MRGLLIALVITGCTHWSPGKGWNAGNTAMEVGYIGASFAEWSHVDVVQFDCSEVNPLLGKCNPEARIPTKFYFPLSMLVHLGLSIVLPQNQRQVFQGITLGAETAMFLNDRFVKTKTDDFKALREYCAFHPNNSACPPLMQ